MDAGLLAQYVIVGLAVVASGAYVVATRLPGVVRRCRGRAALWLVASPWEFTRAAGRRIAPAPRAGACGDCTGCAS